LWLYSRHLVLSVNYKCRCTFHINVHDDYFNKQQNPQRRWQKYRQRSTKHLRQLGSEVIAVNRFPWHFPKFPDISRFVRQIGHPADNSQVYWLLRERNDRNWSRRNTHSLALSVWMNIGHTMIATGDYDCNVYTCRRATGCMWTVERWVAWIKDVEFIQPVV